MGTNYYLHRPECRCCERTPDPEHICKSLTSWHGLFSWDENGDYHREVASVAEWREHIGRAVRTEGAWIEDEYGEYQAHEEFLRRVEAVPADRRRRQFDAICEGWAYRVGDPSPTTDWLDAEGYSFSGGDFS